MNVTRTPRRFESADQLADAVVEKVGRNIVLALPLGLGKADHIAYVSDFLEEAKASGLIKHTIDQAKLRGLQVAPAGKVN